MLNEIQKSLRAYIVADSVIASHVGSRVYGDPPQNLDTFPYIRFGRMLVKPDETDGDTGKIATITIEVYDRPKSGGRVMTQRILDRLTEILNWHDADVSVSGFDLWSMRFTDYNIVRGNDGLSYIGMLLIELRLQNG